MIFKNYYQVSKTCHRRNLFYEPIYNEAISCLAVLIFSIYFFMKRSVAKVVSVKDLLPKHISHYLKLALGDNITLFGTRWTI